MCVCRGQGKGRQGDCVCIEITGGEQAGGDIVSQERAWEGHAEERHCLMREGRGRAGSCATVAFSV